MKIEGKIPAEAYQNEIINPQPGEYSTTGEKEYNAKIGLMYVNEFAYAFKSEFWKESIHWIGTREKELDNWLVDNQNMEWFITRSSRYYDISNIYTGSTVDGYYHYSYFGDVYRQAHFRPSFSLVSNVVYKSGDGSFDAPFRIAD